MTGIALAVQLLLLTASPGALLSAPVVVASNTAAVDTSGWVAPPMVSPDAEVAKPEPQSAPSPTHLGVQLDVGLPDGAGASVVFRPWHFLRLHAGAVTNTVSTGFHGGVSIVPFNFWITPSLTLEGGYLPAGDANGTARMISGNSSFHSAALEDISYGYGSAHVGLEFGPPRRFTFYLRGGLTYLDGNLGGFQALLQQQDPSLTASDMRVRMTLPTVKLGFIVYFI